jgi:hypothetical protein
MTSDLLLTLEVAVGDGHTPFAAEGAGGNLYACR